MITEDVNVEYLPELCVSRCRGICCDPWWGIILYTLKKDKGLSRLSDFKKVVADSIRERVERIKARYITKEHPPRHLFDDPEIYNISVEEVKAAPDGTLLINLRAMFAFRCLFFSSRDKGCLIHPSVLKTEIRPPHCAELGSPDARPGEKGFCRIVYAAVSSYADVSAIDSAVELERKVSERHYNEGFSTVEEASGSVVRQLKEFCSRHLPHLVPVERGEKPGRNEPCPCGSGRKYKRCHGR